jgi:hypothetical protein
MAEVVQNGLPDVFDGVRSAIAEANKGTVVDDPKDIISDPAVINTPAEPVKTETSSAVESPEYLKKWDELSGGKYKFTKDDEVKQFFEKHGKISEENESLKKNDEYFKEVEKFIEEKGKIYDPVSLVGGEERYRKLKVAAELGEGNDEKINIMMSLLSSDRSKMDNFDLISLYTQFKVPDLAGNYKSALEVALTRIGVDTDSIDDWSKVEETLTDKQKGLVALQASEVRESLDRMIKDVKIPDVENPLKELFTKTEQRKVKTQELIGQWNQYKDPIKESIDKLNYEDFDFEIKPEDKEIVDSFIAEVSRRGMEPSEANRQMVTERIKEAIMDKNRSKFLTAYKTHLLTKAKEDFEKEHKNLAPLGTPNTPLAPQSTEADGWMRRNLNLK